MNTFLRQLFSVICLSSYALLGSAYASVVLSGTRVIFPAEQREVTIKATNVGAVPTLVQAWLDTGQAGVAPDQIEVPFTLTPAMFRLDPTKGQTLRVIRSADIPANDRETLYWLNVLEIPPKPKADDGSAANNLQMAFRTRIKLLYRPKGLQGRAEEAPAQVRWSVIRTNDGYRIKGTNPTPYYVNLGSVEVRLSKEESIDVGSGYIAPMASQEFGEPDSLRHWQGQAGAQVEFRFLNDYGAGVKSQSPLSATTAD